MTMQIRSLALCAGTAKRGRFLPLAARIVPVLLMAVALMPAAAGEAFAHRSKAWHAAYEAKHVAHKRSYKRTRHATRVSHQGASRRYALRRKARPGTRYAMASAGSHLKPSMRLGGPIGDASRRNNRDRQVKLASLGPHSDATASPAPSLSGGHIAWRASEGCLTDRLKPILAHIAANFGAVKVNSTCRSPSHNRAVGGVPHSFHLSGRAVDFRLSGNIRATLAYLRTTAVGGIKHYGGGVFHIDTGPRRTW